MQACLIGKTNSEFLSIKDFEILGVFLKGENIFQRGAITQEDTTSSCKGDVFWLVLVNWGGPFFLKINARVAFYLLGLLVSWVL